ncbi:HNH endonuclease [Herbiconiux sp. SALV-R1]|nr:HNH endonuclease [Herbiconiux sp. SALV-R1]
MDTTLDARHARSFTADHDVAINNGGRLVGQTLVPMHRACNARKSDHATVEIWGAT